MRLSGAHRSGNLTPVDTFASDAALDELDRRGFVVLSDILSSADRVEIRAALAPWIEQPKLGRNNFEGYATQRVYSLVALAPIFERITEDPRILAICDRVLEPNYLLTASQAIQIFPGETEQPFHTDDSFYRIPRPRPPVSVSTIFAVDPFTETNGATQVVPGSHRWDDAQVDQFLRELPAEFAPDPRLPRAPKPAAALPEAIAGCVETVVMDAGSVVVFHGTLLHRGAANVSPAPRLAFSNQYCAPWARQQENFFLSIAAARAARMSPRLQSLLGYSIHPPFMGHVAGLHPARSLAVTAHDPSR